MDCDEGRSCCESAQVVIAAFGSCEFLEKQKTLKKVNAQSHDATLVTEKHYRS